MHIKKPTATPKEGEGRLMRKLRERGILTTLAGFIGGAVILIELTHHILVNHYHFPHQSVDIVIISLATGLLSVVTWQWFSGSPKAKRIRFELFLVPLLILIGLYLNFSRIQSIGSDKLSHFTEYKTQEWDNSIAVLPFENMSGDPDQEYFCDGLTEDLITELSIINDLKVVARTSVFAFKGKQDDIREIGKQLNVKNVLEGSVQKSGDQLRITAQLIDVESGFHLWSGRFDKEMEDIFGIQDEITEAIAGTLRLKILGEKIGSESEPETENSEAYDLFLRGRFHANNRTKKGVDLAIGYLERAVEIDPGFALAYAELSTLYTLLPALGAVPASAANPKAKEYALKAIELDDSLAEAHTALGDVKITEYDWIGAEKHFNRAIELNPGFPHAYNNYSYSLAYKGKFEDSIKLIQKAIERDPYNLNYARNLGRILYYEGSYDDAISVLVGTIEINPAFRFVHLSLGMIYLQQEKYEMALEEVQKETDLLETANPTHDCITGIIRARMEHTDTARKIFTDLQQKSQQTNVEPYFLAGLAFALEETDLGFELLEEAYSSRSFWTREVKVDPLFKSAHSDPRFSTLLKNLKLD
jgi:TolB-like protein/tetratricopeptide (TPR) repeat protein